MDSIATDPPSPPAHVCVVGPGRVGRTLADALSRAGVRVSGPTGRGEPVTRADCVLLCVPDAEIPAVAAAVAASAPLIGHTSGATPIAVLSAAGADAAFGLHPFQTFAGNDGPERLAGIGGAVAGSSPGALRCATSLAEIVGMYPFEIADGDRAIYHAAASMASNFLITIEAAAERLLGEAGLDADRGRRLLAPLVRSTVENWQAFGPRQALTGPVARGDHATVALQRAAVQERAPDLIELFDALVLRTEALCEAVSA